MKSAIMAHLVAFYPDEEQSLDVARALVDGGAAILEVQLPFSEPTADGPVIQKACGRALGRGYTLDKGFQLVTRMRALTDIPVFVMTYANVAFRRGTREFARLCREAGADGLIVPDLPFDSDEGLADAAREAGLDVIPVIVPTISDQRLSLVRRTAPRYLYAALRKGITGERTAVGDENLTFIRRASSPGVRVVAGFGIREHGQVEALAPHVHAVIVGSALVAATEEAVRGGTSVYDAVLRKIRSLVES